MVHSWNKEKSLADLNRRLLGRGAVFRQQTRPDRQALMTFSAHTISIPTWIRGKLRQPSESPSLGRLPFAHGSEVIGSLMWPCRVDRTHSIRTSLTWALKPPGRDWCCTVISASFAFV